MKKVVLLLSVCFFTLTLCAQTDDVKKIAILEVVDRRDNVDYLNKLMFRSYLAGAITRTPGYEGYDRVDVTSVLGEHDFQRTGMVSDSQIKEIGRFAGVQYVLIAEAASNGNKMFITAKIIDVETARMISTSSELMGTSEEEMQKGAIGVALKLLGVQGGGTANRYPARSSVSSGTGAVGSGQDFTETAWGINMKMIYVEGGDFLMGCTSEQSGCRDDETNVHRVTLDGFYIGMCEVTQSQWEKVMGTSVYQQRNKVGSSYSLAGVGPDYPMYYVSWEEADEFCRLLSQKTGRTYVLPTEAQWEYAARGGKNAEGTKYSGSNLPDAVAWYRNNSGSTTHIVGTRRANVLGIYDMSGNVWEWCKDWYANSYMNSDTNNPVGPFSGSYRVVRGGSWCNFSGICRVASRSYLSPGLRSYYLGFRVVLLP